MLLPRAGLAGLLDALAEAGIRPDAVEAPLPGGEIRRLPLAPPETGLARRVRRRERMALALSGALAAACLLAPVLRQSFAFATVADAMAAVRPRSAEAQALQRRIAAASAGEDALAQGRLHAADMLTALAALTDALPDDTYLSQLALHKRLLTMEGQSVGAGATRLIALLADEPGLRNPAFTAPVVRGDIGNDIFALQVELAP